MVQLALLLFGGTDSNTGDRLSAVPVGERLANLVSYFTIQSNLFALAAALSLALRPARDGRIWRVVRLDALLGISITGIVYWTLLAPLVDLHGWGLVAGMGFHLVSPLGTVVVWLLVGPRPRITWPDVAWAFLWPVAWVVYTLVRGAETGWYPYPFLDVAEVGYGAALAAVGGVLVLGLLVAALLRRLDKRLRPAPYDPPAGRADEIGPGRGPG